MADFHLTRLSAAPPATVWDVVTDFAAYGDWMPATRMRVDAGGSPAGLGFRGDQWARTGRLLRLDARVRLGSAG